MTDYPGQPGDAFSDEVSEYLPTFMDETEEQLEGLTETLLVLEREPDRAEHLNEAFRLIHSIKGAAGMMGFDNIAALTHHLESRFERFRSGVARLDEPTMNLVLRCIDFLRECIRRLRAGQQLGPSAELVQELSDLDDEPKPPEGESTETTQPVIAQTPAPAAEFEDGYRLVVRFEPGLPLVDLKARLILSRLSNLGEIVEVRPAADALDGIENLLTLEMDLATEQDADVIRAAADVDGVIGVEIDGASGTTPPEERAPASEPEPESAAEPEPLPDPETATEPETPPGPDTAPEPVPAPEAASASSAPPAEPVDAAATAAESVAKSKHTETMRVDIERLDSLLNLTGELVVNRARFVQLASQVTPALGRRKVTGRLREFSERLQRMIDHFRAATDGESAAELEDLEAGLVLLEEQAEIWDSGRRGFAQIGEAIDQLTRISESLQQSVLDTRMVPVAPLFNRFKRVVRDLSTERGKMVDLVIRGEKTELDKRMIDELGDPLVHLVRNSIDHGLESPEVRQARGKPPTGAITLEASHSGNNVFIRVGDDGGGINTERIREKIVERRILDAATAAELTDAQALEYIWHPGFSTAQEVTDVSGRGVGMDAVKTRIIDLNGKVDVESTPEWGTTFTIRLPLTLAIINSLLVRVRDIVFSMPIDDVREIVRVQPSDVVTVLGRQTVHVRGEFIPLVGIDDIFDWRQFDDNEAPSHSNGGEVHAVILHTGDERMGLRVDELIGSQDIVIKSLSENFVHIRGLSGASILGDGNVSLMLDVPTLMELAVEGVKRRDTA